MLKQLSEICLPLQSLQIQLDYLDRKLGSVRESLRDTNCTISCLNDAQIVSETIKYLASISLNQTLNTQDILSIDNQTFARETKDFDVSDLFEQLSKTFKQQTQKQKIKLNHQLVKALDWSDNVTGCIEDKTRLLALPLLSGDIQRLKQVLTCLLDYAVRRTKSYGNVHIQAAYHDTEDELYVKIEHDGYGIEIKQVQE